MKMQILAVAAALALAVPAAADHHKMGANSQGIVETAQGNDQFSTLVAALKAADLVPALQGEGPYTVFAPTNAAFEKLPKGTVENLLKPENKEALRAILTYHVVPGKFLSGDLSGKTLRPKTALGAQLSIDATDGVRVETAQVVHADIETANGVIHVIDRVILPN